MSIEDPKLDSVNGHDSQILRCARNKYVFGYCPARNANAHKKDFFARLGRAKATQQHLYFQSSFM